MNDKEWKEHQKKIKKRNRIIESERDNLLERCSTIFGTPEKSITPEQEEEICTLVEEAYWLGMDTGKLIGEDKL